MLPPEERRLVGPVRRTKKKAEEKFTEDLEKKNKYEASQCASAVGLHHLAESINFKTTEKEHKPKSIVYWPCGAFPEKS